MRKVLKIAAKGVYSFIRAIYKILPIPSSAKARLKSGFVKLLGKLSRNLDPDYDAHQLSTENAYLRAYRDTVLKTGERSEEYAEFKEYNIPSDESGIKPIALYLPQFHTFPENDRSWGKGFTEWVNVTKSVPLFPGHYQPHLPIDIPFYSLTDVNVMKEQVKMAKNYGIYGFMFHYYWFSGRRLMDKPLDNFLNTKDGLDFKFCLNWANESWTRAWAGKPSEHAVIQSYSDEDSLAVIKDICRYIKDERYIRINGKPLIMIYRPDCNHFEYDPKRLLNIWREYCSESGIGEIHVIAALTHIGEHPRVYGFDGCMEFPPHKFGPNMVGGISPIDLDKNLNGAPDMERFINERRYYLNEYEGVYKGIFPNWDNTPRRRVTEATVFQVTPGLYKKWLADIMNHTMQTHEEGDRLVFINAWNEWAEGSHLEPDRRYGYAYLQATAEAMLDMRRIPSVNLENSIEDEDKEKVRLNVGCGSDYREGWINIDGSSEVRTDIIVDLSGDTLLNHFLPDAVDYILANDIVEHHFHWEATALLRDFYTILKPGGSAEIRVPDCEFIIRSWEAPLEEKLTLLFGGQDIPQRHNFIMDESRKQYPQYFCHKYGWTKTSLSSEMQNIGFVVEEINSRGTDFVIKALKAGALDR